MRPIWRADRPHDGLPPLLPGSDLETPYQQQLVEIGVLEKQTFGKERLFLHPKFLNLLRQKKNDMTLYARDEG